MKFGKKRILCKTIIRSYFAWLPIKIDGEARWLEHVNVEGHYWKGHFSRNIYWRPERFVDFSGKQTSKVYVGKAGELLENK